MPGTHRGAGATRNQPTTVIDVNGVRSRIDDHPDHGPVVYHDGHHGEYHTGPQLDEYITGLQRLRAALS